MKEKIERAYNRFVRSLDGGIRSRGGASIVENVEELENLLEELIFQLEDAEL
ncbi:hypothetical protein J0A71_01g00750 [Encephalitozoon cuniculi]|nr:hypothetical protein J0A71_01g00750 [Encephalitozoon cuniculi]